MLPGGGVPLARAARGRTEEEALNRRIEDAPTPAGAALLWIHVHLRDPTSVTHLSHVFAP